MSEEKIEPAYHPMLVGKKALAPHDDDAVREWPTLMSLILPAFDKKGRYTREPGNISIRIDGAVFRVTVMCPTDGVQTVVEVTSLLDLFTQLEQHVSRSTAVWVPTYDSKKKAGQKLRSVLES